MSRLDRTLPGGWFEQALTDLPTLFAADLPSLGSWVFGPDQAAAITQPALTLVGSESAPIYIETHGLLNQWIPNAEPLVLEDTTHFMQWENADGVAAALIGFLHRHGMG